MPHDYHRDRILSTPHFMWHANPLPQDFHVFLEFLHSCGDSWQTCYFLWINCHGSWIIFPSSSWCFCSVLYQKKSETYFFNHFPQIPAITKHVHQIKDFYFCISCEVGLFLKIALKSVEVEDPILWHLSGEEDKIPGGNSSDKGGREVGLWPQLANFKKAFWKGCRYVWKWSYYINSKHKDLAFCWNFLSLATNTSNAVLTWKGWFPHQQKPSVHSFNKSTFVRWSPTWKREVKVKCESRNKTEFYSSLSAVFISCAITFALSPQVHLALLGVLEQFHPFTKSGANCLNISFILFTSSGFFHG